MKVYGLRIGKVGVEFSDQQSREKAMLLFTRGCCVSISTTGGRRYNDNDGAFATYERETKEQQMNCYKCNGVFSSEVCSQREVPETDYSGKFRDGDETETKCLCDGCYAKTIKDYEVFKAKKVVATAEIM